MTHRSFNDDTGRKWEVWDVFPARVRLWLDAERARNPDSPPPARGRAFEDATVPDVMREGWLAFHCENETCRLAPIPTTWPAASENDLLLMLGKARRPTRATESPATQHQAPQTQL